MTNEPALTNGSIVAIFNALQVPILTIPPWAHALLILASGLLGAVATRAKVTPVKSRRAPRKRSNAGRH